MGNSVNICKRQVPIKHKGVKEKHKTPSSHMVFTIHSPNLVWLNQICNASHERRKETKIPKTLLVKDAVNTSFAERLILERSLLIPFLIKIQHVDRDTTIGPVGQDVYMTVSIIGEHMQRFCQDLLKSNTLRVRLFPLAEELHLDKLELGYLRENLKDAELTVLDVI